METQEYRWSHWKIIFVIMIGLGISTVTTQVQGVDEVTVNEIEVNGRDLEGQLVEMKARFYKVDNTWVELWTDYPEGSQTIGFFVYARREPSSNFVLPTRGFLEISCFI